MVQISLEKINTSYWLTKDKDWKERRSAQWPAIEKVVGINRNKAEVNVIKAYFLRGKMPKWEKYKDWDKTFRHLDLRMFLWLHPSDEPEVLIPLYKTYMESDVIHDRDVTAGYGSLLDNELLRAPSPYKSLKDYPFPFMGDKNIILFRIFFADIAYAKECMVRLLDGQESFDEKAAHLFEYKGYSHFLKVWSWLLQDAKSPLMLNCLYQYDEVLEWCLTTITNKSNNEFVKGLKEPVYVTEFQKALYCIYHFDSEKNEVSCRSRALVKVRQLLDDNDFIPEFKQMWEGIKSGKIEVKNPWKRR
jgi:hypothetical protein